MSCLWGSTRLWSPARKKLGLTGFPASTESSTLWLNVFPQSIYSAQRHFVVPKGELNLWGVWWCWWKQGNCDGRAPRAGTGRWNKTLPPEEYWSGRVFDVKCSRSVKLFLHESSNYSPIATPVQSRLILSPQFKVVLSLYIPVSRLNSHNNVHLLALPHKIFDDPSKEHKRLSLGGSDYSSKTSSRTITLLEQYTSKVEAKAFGRYSTLKLVWTPEIAGREQEWEIPISSERHGDVSWGLQGAPPSV